MVEKFKKIVEEISQTNGRFTVFALLKMDEYTSKWSVVFAASWITDENKSEVFEIVRKKIIENLTKEEISSIARIGIFTSDEHLIQELLRYREGTRIESEQVNGNIIHEGYIFASNQELAVV